MSTYSATKLCSKTCHGIWKTGQVDAGTDGEEALTSTLHPGGFHTHSLHNLLFSGSGAMGGVRLRVRKGLAQQPQLLHGSQPGDPGQISRERGTRPGGLHDSSPLPSLPRAHIQNLSLLLGLGFPSESLTSVTLLPKKFEKIPLIYLFLITLLYTFYTMVVRYCPYYKIHKI